MATRQSLIFAFIGLTIASGFVLFPFLPTATSHPTFTAASLPPFPSRQSGTPAEETLLNVHGIVGERLISASHDLFITLDSIDLVSDTAVINFTLVTPDINYHLDDPGTIEKAVDSAGQMLLFADPPAIFVPVPADSPRSIHFHAVIKSPRANPCRIAMIKGHISVAMPGPPKQWLIENPLSAPSQTRDITGERLTFLNLVSRGENKYELFIASEVSGTPASHFLYGLWANHAESIHVIDSSGRSASVGGVHSHSGHTEGAMDFHVSLPQFTDELHEPVLIVVGLPAQSQLVSVPFEFHDISFQLDGASQQ